MALDAALDAIFKEWFTDEKVRNAFYRNDPFLKEIKKPFIGGNKYKVPIVFGNGGSASGDFTVTTTQAAANLASGPYGAFEVTLGYLFSQFQTNHQEILAGQNYRGAFLPIPVLKFNSSTDSFRKVLAAALYGTGFGEIGNAVVATTVVGSNSVDFLDKSLIVKLSIGSVFRVTNGALPSSSLRTSVNTVTAIDGTTVTFDATAIETWAATDWVELNGCRNGSTPLLPIGFGGWLPTIAGRSGGTWATYIATPFFGVDRSKFVQGLAGSYIVRDTGNNEKYSSAILRAIEASQTFGGTPQTLIVNPNKWTKIQEELNAATTYFQSIDGPKGKTMTAQRGLTDYQFQYGGNWIENVISSPYCPINQGYILEMDDWELACLTNAEKPVDDGIQGNDPGKPTADEVGDPGAADQYMWMLDQYLNSAPTAGGQAGPGIAVSTLFFGNFVCHDPSAQVVINFVS